MYEEENPTKLKLNRPHPGQIKVLQSKAKWRVLCCGRRWGKSFICMILAFRSMTEKKAVAYITPNYNLGEDFYRELLNEIPADWIQDSNKASLYIKLKNGGSIKFFSGEATKQIRGRKFDRIILDEAAFIDDLEAVWTQVIMPTLATTNGDALFVSTPNGMNFFHALFLKGKSKEKNYESFHFPSSSSPHVSQEFLETAKATITEDAWRQEYLAEPLASTGNPFGSHHIKENTVKSLSTKETIAFGIDIAKHHDYTVIVGLDEDGCMSYFERYRAEWSVTKDKIKALPPYTIKVMDATGVGDVVFEELVQVVPNLHGFKFTSSSKPQLMKELIVDVQVGALKFNDVTADEMMVFEYTLTSTGYPKYEAQSGYHDDTIAALAMCNRYKKQAFNLSGWKLYTI
jgi:phage FluMu gp28-like protein